VFLHLTQHEEGMAEATTAMETTPA
jgi:hypothetical protein